MKKLSLILIVLLAFFTSCEKLSQKEKELKAQFEKLEKFAETPEQKKLLKEQYKVALKELREEIKENEIKEKLTYSKENDKSVDFLKFCDEIWKDKDYNPAKFNVKEKEFKWKSISFNGEIDYIISEDDRHYLAIKYKEEDKKTSWFTTEHKYITFIVNFEKAEDIMNFKEKQKVLVKGIYDYGHKTETFEVKYMFNFFNPIVK